MKRDIDFPLVVLDCDGTLVDSQITIHAIMAECFDRHGLVVPDIRSVRGIVGLSLEDAFTRLLTVPCPLGPAELAETYRSVSSRLRSSGAFEEPLFPGAREAITELDGAGCVLGIATGKSLRGLKNTLTAHQIDKFFVTLQTSDHAPGKPNPTMLRQAMHEAGAEPGATVMVGDTSFDMEMARAAGAYAVGVAWGYHEVDALHAAGADLVVENYADLLPAIRALVTWT